MQDIEEFKMIYLKIKEINEAQDPSPSFLSKKSLQDFVHATTYQMTNGCIYFLKYQSRFISDVGPDQLPTGRKLKHCNGPFFFSVCIKCSSQARVEDQSIFIKGNFQFNFLLFETYLSSIISMHARRGHLIIFQFSCLQLLFPISTKSIFIDFQLF